MSVDGVRLRIDRWLWSTRFFKTRSLAVEAVRAGHVRINGQRVKAAREVCVGDSLTIVKGLHEFEVTVTQIPARRGPAAEAALCYVESAASIEQRRLRAEQSAAAQALAAPTARRPDRRTRRLIRGRQREPGEH